MSQEVTRADVPGSTSNVEEKKYKYQTEIQQMMYVFGEVQDALSEVTILVEEIVKRHITELVINSNGAARMRGSRFISVDDVVFLIRHDSPKINRLKDYLSWKDLRKNIRDENAVENELAEEEAPEGTERAKKRARFYWEPIKEYTDLLEDDSEDEDEDDLEAYRESLVRLKAADDVTRNMTQSEYMFYSECKTASFTHRKSKRFRDWIQMQGLTEGKPNDDLIDIFGFLCYELVRKITETALMVKKETDQFDTSIPSQSLFGSDKSSYSPLKAIHIHEAYRRLQMVQSHFKLFQSGKVQPHPRIW